MIRILVVEDDTNTLTRLIHHLQKGGYLVRGVMNGNQALETLENEPADIVLCDYSVPEINCTKICLQLKRLQPDDVLLWLRTFKLQN
ncbi:MAG: response regulator [Candidatus Zhuqueibacterota bacterium]